MPPLTKDSKTLIIGSGISGLVLAQSLRKAGLPFEVFERDNGTRPQGWAIVLDECVDIAAPFMPDDVDHIATVSPNYGQNTQDTFAVLDTQSHEIVGITSSKNLGSTKDGYLVGREKYRQTLMKNIDVRAGKHFSHYEESNEGVVAYFKDGTTAHGDILVGADGANSAVRAQLLDGFKATPSSYMVINGSVVLPPDLLQPVLEHGTCGIIGAQPGLKCYLLLLERLPDGSALLNWNLSFKPEDQTQNHAWFQHASPDELHHKALELTSTFPAFFKEAIIRTGSEGIQTPPIRLTETLLPDPFPATGRVTLLGDAAHSMVPFKGMGANTAVLDAVDLARSMIAGVDAAADTTQVLRAYERVMLPRGRAKVLESRAVGDTGSVPDIAGGRL